MTLDMKKIVESVPCAVNPPESSLLAIKKEPPISVSLEFIGMFISRALEKIARDKETKRFCNADLRDACSRGIALLKTRVNLREDNNTNPGSGAHMPTAQSTNGALLNDEQLLLPFELACKSKSPKVVATSLDCLQKLIAYGHVPNNAAESSGDVRIIDKIVRTICACFHGVTTDEGVQLQVIKALLTVVTSPIVEVHERDILLVVQTCYSIYMATRNLINQTTARATLTQMLNVIFQRMEQATLDAAVQHESDLHADWSPKETSRSSVSSHVSYEKVNDVSPRSGKSSSTTSLSKENVPAKEKSEGEGADSETVETPSEGGGEEDKSSGSLVDNGAAEETVGGEANREDGKNDGNDKTDGSATHSRSSSTAINGTTEEPVGGEANKEKNQDDGNEKVGSAPHSRSSSPVDSGTAEEEQTGDDKVDGVVDDDEDKKDESASQDPPEAEEDEGDQRPTSPVENGADDESTKIVEKAEQQKQASGVPNADMPLQRSSLVVLPEENSESTPSPSPAADSSDDGASTANFYFAHVSQKDAFLVFRSLCRLAMKPLATTNPCDPKSHELRSKILSLQLLLGVLQTPGPAFLSNDVFITAIKQYLCVALSINGVSVVPEVFELSLTIFLSLLTHFKQHLKIQIEVFFKDMLLAVLESSSMAFEYKWIVVEVLQRICMDKQCIVDAYLNYDCDLERANVFERLVIGLAKVAQQSSSHSVDARVTPTHLQNLRKRGLECLVLILKCMVRWSNDLFNVSTETHSFLGPEPGAAAVAAGDHHDAESTTSSVGVNRLVSDDPGAFESRKAQKEVYETGIQHFNRGSIGVGLSLLQDNSLLGTSAEEVALFLHNESRLCRTAIGDFLGQNETFPLEVMYAYVDYFDFSGVEFVSALRLFLAGFRLPGEAQKIDRLMEKFAARYFACNQSKTTFASADTAYVLAYSIIMLTTDLHSVKIKQKQRMSKEDYIKMNRGINDSQDLPREYLGQIYDEIAQCEIQMRGGSTGTSTTANGVNGGGSTTTNGMTAGVRDLMESVSHMQSAFTSATHLEHVRPMFKLVWTPFLAAFSVGLQDCDDLLVAHHCLEGIQCAIRIACTFRMELERDAYVQALARFTLLVSTSQQNQHVGPGGNAVGGGSAGLASSSTTATRSNTSGLSQSASSPSLHHVSSLHSTEIPAAAVLVNPSTETMKSKNVDSIRTLISVAQTDGNYLGHSWLHILRCISQLESANVISTTTVRGLTPKHRQASSSSTPSGSSSTGAATITTAHSMTTAPRAAKSRLAKRSSHHLVAPGSLAAATVDSRKAAVLQEVMCETGSHSVVVAVDKIFSGSVRLDGDAIVDFVKALCQVSLEELSLSQPRTFSLQKVVEISYYNIGRIRLQWSRVWEHIGQHFITAGRSTNEDVALFAVDSLRQLSVKLIEKGELPNFHFQKEFLRPFLSILDNVKEVGPSIQDMVVRCISQLIQSQWTNVRSGWTNIFVALYLAASLPEEAVVEVAFGSCSFVINTIFPNNFYLLIESFPFFIKALAEFACNLRFPDISMEAIRLIRQCARIVSERAPQFDDDAAAELEPATTTKIKTPSASNADQPEAGVETDHRDTVEHRREEPLEEGGEEQLLAHWSRGWMPVLYELFRIINICKLDVRTRALTVFFEIIKTYGATFRLPWWIQIFKLVFSIFEHGRDTGGGGDADTPKSMTSRVAEEEEEEQVVEIAANRTSGRQRLVSGIDALLEPFSITYRVFAGNADRSEWLNTTCNHSLYSVVDIFSQFFDRIGDTLLASLYDQLRWCCLQDHEQLTRSGTSCLETIVLTNGRKFNTDQWNMTVNLLVDLFKTTLPHKLLTWRPDPAVEGTSADEATARRRQSDRTRLFLRLLINCVVQYELIQTVDNILFFSSRSRQEDTCLLKAARLESAKLNANFTQPSQSRVSRQAAKMSSGASPRTARTPEEKRLLDAVTAGVADSSGSPTAENFSESVDSTGGGGDYEGLVNGEFPLDARATYTVVSFENRLTLVNCLLESHKFAKTFNSDLEQRNILWEAGFKAKAKPNLLKQETHSLSSALRILFRLSGEENESQEMVTALLEETIEGGVAYYRGLPLDGHRQAWECCILLMLTRLVHLKPDSRFHRLTTRLYPCFCGLVGLPNLAPEISVLLSTLLMRARPP